MSDASKRRALARGEATSKIHWGADANEVRDLLHRDYGIDGDEADAMIAEAVKARRSAIRKKAAIGLGFAAIGLAVSLSYFAIQGFVGFVAIGFGPILMAFLGFASFALAARSAHRLLTGESSGPV